MISSSNSLFRSIPPLSLSIRLFLHISSFANHFFPTLNHLLFVPPGTQHSFWHLMCVLCCCCYFCCCTSAMTTPTVTSFSSGQSTIRLAPPAAAARRRPDRFPCRRRMFHETLLPCAGEIDLSLARSLHSQAGLVSDTFRGALPSSEQYNSSSTFSPATLHHYFWGHFRFDSPS